MQEDPVFDELRALPREKPRAGFAERVLARLGEAPPRRPVPFAPGWTAWAAASLALCAVAAWSMHHAEVRRERRQQMAFLRAEGEQLATELAELRASVDSDGSEVIYLGGDEATDYVIDLSRLARDRNELNPQPASYRDGR